MPTATASMIEVTQDQWNNLDSKVLWALRESKGKAPSDRGLSIKEYFDAYAYLLKNEPEWSRIEKYVTDKDFKLTRGYLSEVSASCLGNEKKGEKDNAWTWPSLFIITCLWGYNKNDKAGPVKLFYAMRKEGAREIIKDGAEMAREGQLKAAFKTIDRLDQIGTSYATKFLYAVGTSKPDLCPPPVILDGVIYKRLQEIGGDDLARRAFAFDSTKHGADGYDRYCKAVRRWANELSLQSADVELLLFELPRGKKISS